MAHFGIISPPVPGHLNPFGALGRELISRGHRVSLVQMADLADRTKAEGLEFLTVGESDHPKGSLPESLARLGQLEGLGALRFTVEAIRKTTEMICRDAPPVLQKAGITALLVDQTEPAGGTVAEHLRLPFITICNALVLSSDLTVPPPFTPWRYKTGALAQFRNWLGYAVSRRITAPVERVIGEYRARWGLKPLQNQEDSFSSLAQISQQPRAFDFPRSQLPPCFYYVGPLRFSRPNSIPFPWEKLDGRPLIYASLGTLQNRKETLFRTFAEACMGLDAQLVITHGGGLSDDIASSFPGNPIVVPYAPQIEVLQRAKLTLTHAGLNTVLDSLTYGVPLVAVPITYEQPAIASRIQWTGVGEVIPLGRLRVERLREAIQKVLREENYYIQAEKVRQSIAAGGGVARAASIIEQQLQERG